MSGDLFQPGEEWRTFENLVRFETVLWARVDQALRSQAALTLGDLTVMTVVGGLEVCLVRDIARTLAITVGGASQAADRVVRRGLCERRTDPADARSSVLALTQHGRGKLVEGDRVGATVLREHFAVLDHTAAQTFGETIRMLRQSALG